MKLREFLPELPELVKKEQQLNHLTGILSDINLMKSGESARMSSLGVDQAVVNAWLRQQMAYRQQMIIDLQTIAFTIEEIRSPINRIIAETFRKGIEWKPKFTLKCMSHHRKTKGGEWEQTEEECGEEYTESVERCKKCGATNAFIEPDESQKERPDEFIKDANIFDQSLEEVLRQFHFALNSVDDGYLHIVKEYYAEENDQKVRSRVIEIRHLNPALVEIDLDEVGLPKNSHFICYLHRETDSTSEGACGECGRDLIPAMYKYWHRGKALFLTDSEVVHSSKFNGSETYGWSPILTIFEKALSLRGMDAFLYRYFFERRMPAAMVMVFTDDPESLRRERENIAARTRLDPNYIPMVAVSSRSNRGRVDLVRLFHTLQEMDYLPVRQEIRERVAAMWGVTPAWQGAPEAFGGLSTQTTQLTVMSRVIEADQRLFHEKVFPLILDAFGVTDWEWELPQPEEKAEATQIQFAQQRVAIANMLFQMGFDIEIVSEEVGLDEIDFKVSGKAEKPDMMGGMGMFGGGGMGGGMPPEGGQEAEGGEEELQFMQKAAEGWVSQIVKAGYLFPEMHGASASGDAVFFKYNGIPHIAKFMEDGSLYNIEKVNLPRLHKHGKYSPHLETIHHNEIKNRVDFKEKLDDIDEPEEGDN